MAAKSRKTKEAGNQTGARKVKQQATAEIAQMREMAKRPVSSSKINKGSRRRMG